MDPSIPNPYNGGQVSINYPTIRIINTLYQTGRCDAGIDDPSWLLSYVGEIELEVFFSSLCELMLGHFLSGRELSDHIQQHKTLLNHWL